MELKWPDGWERTDPIDSETLIFENSNIGILVEGHTELEAFESAFEAVTIAYARILSEL